MSDEQDILKDLALAEASASLQFQRTASAIDWADKELYGAAYEHIVALKNRIRELEERLHARLLAVAALAQQSTDRDAAWERAIQSLAEQGVITIDDPIAAVRERMEAEGGGA